MSLINYKIQLKLKWTKQCVLATGGVDNTNADPNNIIFTIKDTKLCPCCHITSKRLSKTIKTSQQMVSKISVLK